MSSSRPPTWLRKSRLSGHSRHSSHRPPYTLTRPRAATPSSSSVSTTTPPSTLQAAMINIFHAEASPSNLTLTLGPKWYTPTGPEVNILLPLTAFFDKAQRLLPGCKDAIVTLIGGPLSRIWDSDQGVKKMVEERFTLVSFTYVDPERRTVFEHWKTTRYHARGAAGTTSGEKRFTIPVEYLLDPKASFDEGITTLCIFSLSPSLPLGRSLTTLTTKTTTTTTASDQDFLRLGANQERIKTTLRNFIEGPAGTKLLRVEVTHEADRILTQTLSSLRPDLSSRIKFDTDASNHLAFLQDPVYLAYVEPTLVNLPLDALVLHPRFYRTIPHNVLEAILSFKALIDPTLAYDGKEAFGIRFANGCIYRRKVGLTEARMDEALSRVVKVIVVDHCKEETLKALKEVFPNAQIVTAYNVQVG